LWPNVRFLPSIVAEKNATKNGHTKYMFNVYKNQQSRQTYIFYSLLAVDDRHVAFCEYNGSVARIICVAVATLANEKLLECASDNDLLLCRKSTSNKTRYRQWFDRCIISKMILKSGSNWLFPVVFSVEITLSRSHSGNNFEFSHRLTIFASQGLRFGSPFSPPLADLEYILKFTRNATWWFIEVAPLR
jgi:hypothetical protein